MLICSILNKLININKMINKLIKKFSCCNIDAGLLVLRIGVAIIFIMAGGMKVANLAGTVGFFASLGFGAFWAYLVSFVELIGGIAILLGVYTRFVAIAFAVIMVVVMVVTKDPTQLMAPMMIFFSSVSLILAGGGKYSVMKKLCGCGTCAPCVDSDVSPSAGTTNISGASIK